MTTHQVIFLPDNVRVEVPEGTSLLEAAGKANVDINSVCGGIGVCGQCVVQILKGTAPANSQAVGFLTKEELQSGHVLACQTSVQDDLQVMIPARSRAEKQAILTEGASVSYSRPEQFQGCKKPSGIASPVDPLVQKAYLELPPPTIDDNIADIDRVARELVRKGYYDSFEISLASLQGLADKLRDNAWKVTPTIACHRNGGRILQVEGGDTSRRNYGLAIDVGTTTVVVQLVDLNTGQVIGIEGSHNQQARYGADVISRMIYACGREGSVDSLHHAIIDNINALIKTAAAEKKVDRNDITSIVAAGNTTMSHFLLALVPCAIRLDPYVPTATVYPQVMAREIGIEVNSNAMIEVMPTVSSYVGGDIIAGILACGMAERPEVSCLIDAGTNAEIVIGNNDWLVCCSASAGPAFEGGGARSGMRAASGAIQTIEIKGDTATYTTIDGAKPRGICGSGLVDTIYELVRNHIIDKNGRFNKAYNTDRLITDDNGGTRYVIAFGDETETGQPITISEPEIGSLIKAKAAVFAAMKSLIGYVGIGFEELTTIYVAGGFGNSFNIPKAIGIGLLPDIDPAKFEFIGNSSVTGARMALVSTAALRRANEIGRMVTNIELSNYPSFMEEFMGALFLPHTHRDLFPSVTY